MGFEEFEPIYGEPKAEWGKSSDFGRSAAPLRRFLMHVFSPDYYHLKIQATDYNSNTFEANKSITQLEDLQDSIGIGGSWSEFVDYFISSLESEDVKLVLEKHSGGDGAASARLVSQKTKGMPLISISLRRVLDFDANDVMADISFGLFKTLKCSPKMTRQGQSGSLWNQWEGYSSQLMKGVATDEKQKNQLESQLGKRQELRYVDAFNKEGVSSNGSHNSPDKQPARAAAAPKKVINRVVPAHRRTRVRGALIGDAEDDDEES